MLRKLTHLFGEIRRWCAQLYEMGDACRRVEADPIEEIGGVPQCRMRPKHGQMVAKRSIRIRVFRLRNCLGDVGSLSNGRALQCSGKSIESLITWKM